MFSYIFMKILEAHPRSYDRRISRLSGGRIVEIKKEVASAVQPGIPARWSGRAAPSLRHGEFRAKPVDMPVLAGRKISLSQGSFSRTWCRRVVRAGGGTHTPRPFARKFRSYGCLREDEEDRWFAIPRCADSQLCPEPSRRYHHR